MRLSPARVCPIRTPWNQYVVITTNALDAAPLFLSATGNDPATNPVHKGPCLSRCGGMWDFLDVQVSATGDAWAAASDDCSTTCNGTGTKNDHDGEGIVIRQIGGPKLRG